MGLETSDANWMSGCLDFFLAADPDGLWGFRLSGPCRVSFLPHVPFSPMWNLEEAV